MSEKAPHHEYRAHGEIKTSSDRSFGVTFAVLFALLACLNVYKGSVWWPGLIAAGAVILAIALLRPSLLAAPNRWWTKLGLLLATIVNPIVMAFIFFVIFTPVALVIRLLGKDLLRLRFDDKASSYWIVRDPAGPDPKSMKDQF